MFKALHILALSLVLGACAFSQPKPLELKWNELAGTIVGHQVVLTLPDGVRVRGEAAYVRDTELVLDVTTTSDRAKHPKGSMNVPRDSVTTLKVERGRGSWGRGVGFTVGLLGGMTLGGYAGAHTNSPAPALATFLGVSTIS